MAFFDELKTLEATTTEETEAILLLKALIREHKKTLLKNHLDSVYEGLKESIKKKALAGTFDGQEGERRIKGIYRFGAFVPMDLSFVPPYPEGITEKMVKNALKYTDQISIPSRVRIEPSFYLQRQRIIRFGEGVKNAGEAYFEGDSLWFVSELESRMRDDKIKLVSITVPSLKTDRLITLSGSKERVKCSYTVHEDAPNRLNYDDLAYISIRYSIKF